MRTRPTRRTARLATALLVLAAASSLARAADDVVAPGENLVVEGVPPIPRALAEAVGRYGEIRQAYFTGWHPTKREMLVITRLAETYQVHRVAMPGGARQQLTFFREGIYGGVRYEPKAGAFFTFRKDVGGNENYQIYRYDVATGAPTLLSDGASRNTANRMSNSGRRVVYGSTRRTGNDVDLWVVDPLDPSSQKLLAELSGGGWEALDWSADDSKILLQNGVSANSSDLFVVDAATGAKELVLKGTGDEKISIGAARFAKDGKSVFLTTDKDSEFLRLARLDLATKKLTFLTQQIPWDLDEIELSPDGKTIAFVANEDGVGTLRLLDTATGKEKPAPKLPVGIVSGLRWRPNGKELGFNFESGKSPADVYSADVATGKVERWTYSETGGLPADRFSEPELVRWKTFDGKTISGFLYRPPKSFTGRRPVIVDIHGGPEGQSRPGFLGSDNYFQAELGAVRIYPNVRGSAGYGKTFLKLDDGFLREGSYKDVVALFDWIKTQPDLDADRILVTGGSYGGFMTLALAAHYSDRIRSALAIVGPSNLVTFLENTSGYRRDLRRVEYGDERDPKMREFLNRIAPANNAHQIAKPLFVVQGKNDPRVPASESEQMVATARKAGASVWYLMAKDEGHGFGKKSNTDFLLYATAVFVKESLLK